MAAVTLYARARGPAERLEIIADGSAGVTQQACFLSMVHSVQSDSQTVFCRTPGGSADFLFDQ
jgi:hypothetical protein